MPFNDKTVCPYYCSALQPFFSRVSTTKFESVTMQIENCHVALAYQNFPKIGNIQLDDQNLERYAINLYAK